MDKNIRLDMENPIFKKLQDVLERPCRSKEWFGLAEQAINTVYALGERPDLLCDALIKNLTRRAFTRRAGGGKTASSCEGVDDGEEKNTKKVKKVKKPRKERDPDGMDEDEDEDEEQDDDEEEEEDEDAPPDVSQEDAGDKDVGDVFEMSQLLFVVGHVAIKHIVYLELVEREWKRQKHEKEQGVFSPLFSHLTQPYLMLFSPSSPSTSSPSTSSPNHILTTPS